MRQFNSFVTFCFALVFIVAMVSCSKEGPAGPAGATGATGATGAAGATGATGAAGAAGTANVIYSAWTSISFNVDTIHSGGVIDTVGSDYTWSVPKLTAAIVNTGELKVYVNLGTTAAPDIAPIPYFDGQLILNDEFLTGQIYLYSNYIIAASFRYVLIPGGVPARSSIDWNNYAAVKKALNLPD
jgi:hypothetical protein